MSKPKDVHIVPKGETWATVRPGNSRVIGIFNTQQEAIEQGRQIAQK